MLLLQCPTGSECVHSACTSSTCSSSSNLAKSCGASGSNCLCAADDTGAGYCVQDVPNCGDIIGQAPDVCQTTGECKGGYVCAPSRKCGKNMCIGSGGFAPPTSTNNGTTSTGGNFPPPVTPADGPKSGWQMTFDSPTVYQANEFSLPSEDWYLMYNGKRTVNTRCIQVGDLPFAPFQKFPSGAVFTWETGIADATLNPDTCCLAIFEGTECVPNAAGVQNKPSFYCDAGIKKVPFVSSAWMVYNCTGLWTGQAV